MPKKLTQKIPSPPKGYLQRFIATQKKRLKQAYKVKK